MKPRHITFTEQGKMVIDVLAECKHCHKFGFVSSDCEDERAKWKEWFWDRHRDCQWRKKGDTL